MNLTVRVPILTDEKNIIGELMRRKEREVIDHKRLEEIILSAEVCHLAINNQKYPYIIPLSFGYKENKLYFHCAKVGTKLDLIKIDPNVSFEFTADTELITGPQGCDWSTKYRSVMGFGTAKILDCTLDKIAALDILMQHYAPSNNFTFPDKMVEATEIFVVEILGMTGKESGYKQKDVTNA